MISISPIKVNLDFTKIEIYEDYLVSTVNEGIVFDTPKIEQINSIFDTYFPGKYFCFISNKVNDYTINPTCIMKASKYQGLLGVAALCYTKSSFDNSLFVKKFYSKPYKAFYTLEECKLWFDSLRK